MLPVVFVRLAHYTGLNTSSPIGPSSRHKKMDWFKLVLLVYHYLTILAKYHNREPPHFHSLVGGMVA